MALEATAAPRSLPQLSHVDDGSSMEGKLSRHRAGNGESDATSNEGASGESKRSGTNRGGGRSAAAGVGAAAAPAEINIPAPHKRKMSPWNNFVVQIAKNKHSSELIDPYRTR